jgi:hypothetical protein
VNGFADVIVERVATGKFPNYRVRLHVAHLILMEPEVREKSDGGPPAIEHKMPETNGEASRLATEGMMRATRRLGAAPSSSNGSGSLFDAVELSALHNRASSGKRVHDEQAPAVATSSTGDDNATSEDASSTPPPIKRIPAMTVDFDAAED